MKSSTIGLGLSFGQNLSRNEPLLLHKKIKKKKTRNVDQHLRRQDIRWRKH